MLADRVRSYNTVHSSQRQTPRAVSSYQQLEGARLPQDCRLLTRAILTNAWISDPGPQNCERTNVSCGRFPVCGNGLQWCKKGIRLVSADATASLLLGLEFIPTLACHALAVQQNQEEL